MSTINIKNCSVKTVLEVRRLGASEFSKHIPVTFSKKKLDRLV
jgi:hypothetical protein